MVAMGEHVWIIWVVALVILTLIIALTRFIIWRVNVKRGVHVHNKVDAVLKRYGVIRNFKVLKDFDISANGETVRVEHALIGFFGIVFLTARGETADFYGERKSDSWLMIKDDKKTKIENPIAHNEDVMRVARNVLGQNKVYSIPMEGIVVFSGRPKKTTIYCADNTVMRYKELYKYLNKAKFDKDNNLDVEKIKELLINSTKQK